MKHSLTYRLIAMAEVLGRNLFGRFPGIKKRAHRLVRKPPAENAPIFLDELKHTLTNLGICEGDTLMVHSAWDGMRLLQAKPSEVIDMLDSLLGSSGTLIMPTSPITAMRSGKIIYDIDKAPSSLGLLSECFRRTAHVMRSSFPMAVSARGPKAPLFLRDFRQMSGNTSYGYGSPYWEMGAQKGKVLMLGIDPVRTLTLQHCAFDILGDDNPIAEYYTNVEYIVIMSGKEDIWTIKRPHPRLAAYLATIAFSKMIDDSGTQRKTNLKGMKIALVDAAEFIGWHLPLARQYGWPYWGFPRAKEGR